MNPLSETNKQKTATQEPNDNTKKPNNNYKNFSHLGDKNKLKFILNQLPTYIVF